MRILASCGPGEVRVAAWDGGALVDYAIERAGAPDGVGDVHRGRVIARLPAMAGSFVQIVGAEGFLPDSEGGDVPEGRVLAVRITRAAQGGKGPRLSARALEAVVSGPTALLRRGPGAVERLAALHPEAEVFVDDAAAFAALRPVLGERLTRTAWAFDDDVEDAVAGLGQAETMLPGGARMHVHATPAVTAIDLDMAGLAAGRGAKRTAHEEANRVAIPALARQIRLRNLGGGIIVDLAGLSAKRRGALGPALAAALEGDPLKPRFLGFSGLGFAEILRPRVHPPLHEVLAGPHAAGLVGLRALADEAAAKPGMAFALQTSPAIATALRADMAAQEDILRLTGRKMQLLEDQGTASWRVVPA